MQSHVGFDGNKKIKGRKRHILIDTLGLIVAVVVTAANTDDRLGLVLLLQRYFASGVKRLRKLWVDGGYQAQWLWDWVRCLKRTHKVDLEVVERSGKGFQVVKHRWKVERTLAWILNDRRHSRDYERLTVRGIHLRRDIISPFASSGPSCLNFKLPVESRPQAQPL